MFRKCSVDRLILINSYIKNWKQPKLFPASDILSHITAKTKSTETLPFQVNKGIDIHIIVHTTILYYYTRLKLYGFYYVHFRSLA